jgi:hypothetical protein
LAVAALKDWRKFLEMNYLSLEKIPGVAEKENTQLLRQVE